jgi:uncharacterized membrane protein YkvA (DUF1232 family)
MKAAFERIGSALRRLKRELHAVFIAARDPRTPWAARILAALVLAYALSPIDLIPDFIPVLGYLDDLILVPLGLWLCLRLIPSEIMDEARERAATGPPPGRNRIGVVLVVTTWLVVAGGVAWWLLRDA